MYAEKSPTATEEKPFLLAALRVQKCWAELTLHCKALQSMGVENVAYASSLILTLLINLTHHQIQRNLPYRKIHPLNS